MSFRGTSVGQNTKFSNKEQKLLKSIKFPAVYAQPINVQAINMDAMRDWAAKRIFELLGVDDDIVTEMVFEYLAEDNLDPRRLHINLMPFLEANTTTFMKELWKLLVSASTSIGGIPREFIEARKRDILAAQGDQQRLIQDMDANAAAVQEHGYHALQPLAALPPRPHHMPARFDPADRSARDRYAAPQQPQQYASRWAAPPHGDYDRSARDRAAPPPPPPPARRMRSRSRSRSRTPPRYARRRSPSSSPPRRTARRGRSRSVSRSPSPRRFRRRYSSSRSRSRSPRRGRWNSSSPSRSPSPRRTRRESSQSRSPSPRRLPVALTLAFSVVVAVALPAPPSPRKLVPVSIALAFTVALSAAPAPPVNVLVTRTVTVAVPSPPCAQPLPVAVAVSLAGTQS
ncbi:hypothetical protein GGF32_003361 [Allomyces javanicus]|nr:hypothetical protein GGF32_003361 [Allomyces javanicus]